MINEYINDIESLKKQNLYRKLSNSEALSSNVVRKNNQNLDLKKWKYPKNCNYR